MAMHYWDRIETRHRVQPSRKFSSLGTCKTSLEGYPIRDSAPPLLCPTFRDGNLIDHSPGAGDQRASTAATGRRIVPSIPESLFRRPGCFGSGVGPSLSNPHTEVSRTHLALTEEASRGPEISRDMSRFSGRRFRTERETDSNDTESAEAVSCPLRQSCRCASRKLDSWQFYRLHNQPAGEPLSDDP
jgi:hypothetical protein